MIYRNLVKPLLFQLDAERAHHLVIDGMHIAGKFNVLVKLTQEIYGVSGAEVLSSNVFGLHFPHPIGLAAGLDKNAKAVNMFEAIGFGFAEVGTVTPKGQAGNAQPRLFRLPSDEALINRMGFNNDGAARMAQELKQARHRNIPLAINIGKNKSTPNELAHEDYRSCVQQLYEYGDFFVVNISSPNTPDLRALQHGDELHLLLKTVLNEVEHQAALRKQAIKPVLVKIAPDLTDEQLTFTVDSIQQSGVAGIIATNTTISREGLTHPAAQEAGGLSGRPLTKRSTEVIRAIYKQTGGTLPIVGSGGIFDANDAYDKIRAGASLVEIYSSLIYYGPGLLRDLVYGLTDRLRADGFTSITDAVGADHRDV